MQPNSPDIAACRALLKTGSKSFFAASLLLPKRVRDPASALYAFCRLADDAVDLSADPRQALSAIRFRLDRAYAGQPLPSAVDRAFAEVIARHSIPRAVPDALFEGFQWDVERRTYETLADLEAYAVRVAGTVGIMMTMLMGVREADVLARACDLGVAMQLTNIARDVGEDARAGRLYLPRDWLKQAGIAPAAFLRTPRHSKALASVVARLLDVAGDYYARANIGIAGLPGDCRPAIRAASLIYARIGGNLARQGHDAVTARAVVSKAAKVALIGLALRPSHVRGADLQMPAIAAARDLIAASALAERIEQGDTTPRSLTVSALTRRFVGVVDLFERLERRALSSRINAIR